MGTGSAMLLLLPLTATLLLVTCSADLIVTAPTAPQRTATSVSPAAAAAAAAGVAAGTAAEAEATEKESDLRAGADMAVAVSCRDHLNCYCTQRNGTVDIQCRYEDQNVVLRRYVLTSSLAEGTRLEIDLQTRGFIMVLSSFWRLKLKPPADGRPSVMFIIRDATMLDVTTPSDADDTFTAEWHLNRVNLSSLNVKQLFSARHRLLLTVRSGRVGALRLSPLPAGSRLTLDGCQVGEVTGLPPPPGDVPPPPPRPPPEGAARGRTEVIVRKCTVDTLRTAAFSIEDAPGQSAPSLLFAGNVIGEMERTAISVRTSSCQLTFTGNEVRLLQHEVFSIAGGALRISNNTLHLPHAAAFRGFCGQVSLLHNDMRVPPAFGALHFDTCARYSVQDNMFQCPCDGVGWLTMFERRQRPNVLEVFYERLLSGSYCDVPAGKVPMAEFALLEDCSGAKLRSTLVIVTAVLAAATLVLLLALVLYCCYRGRRDSTSTSTKLQQPRLRRPKNLYSSDISAPISKPGAAAAGGRPATAPSCASLSALSGMDARNLGHYVTLESEEDDALYATIVYKKRRAPEPPPGSTPGPRRAASHRILNRCVSEGGIRLPAYSSVQGLPARKVSGAGADALPEGIAEETENPYLVPDGTASDYAVVPPPQQLYEEIMPVEEPTVQEVRSGWAAPQQQGKICKDSGIGDDLCLEAMRQEGPVDLGAGVYSPPVRPRRP